MEIDYRTFVERMIQRYEGGYGWDVNDPGGPTKFGVTAYDLAEFMHRKMDSMVHWAPIVQAMSLATADEIYATKYATACHFNDLGPGKDCVVMDFGVNSGSSRAIKYAQRVVHVTDDGIIGPITLKAINDADPYVFINWLCDARLRFLQALGIWSTFGRGWAARVADLRAYSLRLAYPVKGLPEPTFVEKLDRIPLAFAKGYAPEDLVPQ